jgi:hypothetical protein
MLKLSRLAGVLAVVVLVGAISGGAAAQSRAPVTTAPLPIAPPDSQQEWERAERAREQLNYQRERDRLDLERRQLRNEAIREGQDSRDRGLLGAPVFVQPGAAPYYAAPQYPYSGAGPGYAAPPYGLGYGAARACQQFAPAYDEAGRFLANVCVR